MYLFVCIHNCFFLFVIVLSNVDKVQNTGYNEGIFLVWLGFVSKNNGLQHFGMKREREREKEAKRKQTIRFFLAGNHLHFQGRPPPRPRAASPPSR